MQFAPNSTSGIVYMTRFYAKANSNDLTTQDIANLSNISLDEIYPSIAYTSRTLNFDDPNYGDDPYELYDITSGTARVPLTTDGNSASVLGIRKVAAADSAGNFRIINLANLDEVDSQGFVNQSNTSGVPQRYFQFNNTLVLDPTPDYSRDDSIRVFYKRALDHFTSSDTSAEPGFDSGFHNLVPLMNAHKWCRREGKTSAANALLQDIAILKAEMVRYYGLKAGDNLTQGLRTKNDSTK